MIKIENTEVSGWQAAIRGMRNPMNSWDKSDSWYGCRKGDYGHIDSYDCLNKCRIDCEYCLGINDLDLMKRLVNAGSDHSKFMRMINITVDVTAPLYWWKEADTYKIGTVRNSCSTMHKIHAKEFKLDDFSHDHLFAKYVEDDNPNLIWYNEEYPNTSTEVLEFIIASLNQFRKAYLETNDKMYWWQMIQLLPSSYNQRSTLQLNYAVLRNIYHSRKNHKLDEWHDFCHWIEGLPYSELIII